MVLKSPRGWGKSSDFLSPKRVAALCALAVTVCAALQLCRRWTRRDDVTNGYSVVQFVRQMSPGVQCCAARSDAVQAQRQIVSCFGANIAALFVESRSRLLYASNSTQETNRPEL